MAASRSASTPWAATSVNATVASSSATTSTPASTAPTVSSATRTRHGPSPAAPSGPWKLPSPHLDSGDLRVKAGGFGGGLNGCFVLLVSVLLRTPPSSRPPPAPPGLLALLGFLCGGEVGPQMGRCDPRSCFPFWAEGRLWPGSVGPHSPRSPSPRWAGGPTRLSADFLVSERSPGHRPAEGPCGQEPAALWLPGGPAGRPGPVQRDGGGLAGVLESPGDGPGLGPSLASSRAWQVKVRGIRGQVVRVWAQSSRIVR